ncbi:MAG: amidohydrolase [Acidobacteriota bacterium]
MFFTLAATSRSAQAAPPPADLILRGGTVYTLDAPRSWAEAVAVTQGKLVYVGTNPGAEAFIGPRTKVVELAGRMVLPSFRDSHVHPISSGVDLARCDLNAATTKEQALAAIRRYAAAHPDAKWILGGGWQLPLFPAANPNRADLDTAVPDRPAFLSAADGHSGWANSRALKLAGVTRSTRDPEGGRIERDASGEPSGTLRESAQRLIDKHIPEATEGERREGLRRALRMAAGFGITTLNEAAADESDLETYGGAEQAGELTARIVVSLELGIASDESEIGRLARLRERYKSARLSAPAIKMFADGVIESGTAALLEPYLNRPGDRGTLNFAPARFAALATAADKQGFQIHIHAIGDRAVRVALDALEVAQKANGARDSRHHIAHLELIDPADIPRFGQLGVIANFQALWAYADPYIVELTEPVLGPARSRWLYPLASVARAGGMIVGGSDWSVSSLNPLDAIQVAVTRRDPDSPAGPAWIPEERMELADMLAAYTIRGAYLNFEEKTTGSLEVGKSADLIVLEKNLFRIPAEEIHSTKVLLTLLAGAEVFRDPAMPK